MSHELRIKEAITKKVEKLMKDPKSKGETLLAAVEALNALSRDKEIEGSLKLQALDLKLRAKEANLELDATPETPQLNGGNFK